MYLPFIIATMLVLPVIAVLVEMRRKEHPLIELIGKWFIFFGGGVRLFVAGLVQIINPGFTVGMLQSDASLLIIVRELGFTNLLLAGVALVSVYKPDYRVLGTGGALFMGFAGILHLSNLSSSMTTNEMIALWSDLWIGLIAVIYLVYRFTRRRKTQANLGSPLQQK